MSRFLKMPTPRGYTLPENIVTEVTNWLHEKGRSILNDATSAFNLEGILAEEEQAEAADPAEKIIEAAEAGNYNLIIAGNSGGEDADEADLHLGSVAKAVALGAKTSVLIVRQRTSVKSILVPTDGSPRSEEVLSNAAWLAEKLNAKITLLHVQESSVLNFRPRLKEVGTQILDSAADRIEGVEFVKLLRSGDPAKVILETANEQKPDLIVMGKGKRRIMGNVMLGNVSDHVLSHAAIPVLLVSSS
jgi:nucleotide-binding universal stress UspA family protein